MKAKNDKDKVIRDLRAQIDAQTERIRELEFIEDFISSCGVFVTSVDRFARHLGTQLPR